MFGRSKFTTILSIIVIVVFVILSPLLLIPLSTIYGTSWAGVSDIGQAYGAISAIISTFALVGVSISLILQNREHRLNSMWSHRTYQLELAKLAMENPQDLLPVWFGRDINEQAAGEYRTRAFITLVFKFAEMGYLSKEFPEENIQQEFGSHFNYELVRDWWQKSRAIWLGSSQASENHRRFIEMLDAAYSDAMARSAESA